MEETRTVLKAEQEKNAILESHVKELQIQVKALQEAIKQLEIKLAQVTEALRVETEAHTSRGKLAYVLR